jgi:hypothetical protein
MTTPWDDESQAHAPLMMDIQARYLVFNSALVLLAGLLVGVPYGRAVHRNAPDQVIRAWRLAHGTLTLGPTLGLAIAAVLSSLSVGPRSSPGSRGLG